MQTPPQALSSSLRSFAQDELTRVVLILGIVIVIGLIVLAQIVSDLAPAGVPASGVAEAVAHVYPDFQDTPSRVQMNGKPLTVTLRATGTRVDVGYNATHYLFTVDPPNDPPMTLCDSDAPTCPLALDGTRRQAGTWIITVRVYDNTGASATTRTRLRVT